MIYNLSAVQAFNHSLQLLKVPEITVRSDYPGTLFKGQASWRVETALRFWAHGLGVSFSALQYLLLVKGSKDASWLTDNAGKQSVAQKSFNLYRKRPQSLQCTHPGRQLAHEKIEQPTLHAGNAMIKNRPSPCLFFTDLSLLKSRHRPCPHCGPISSGGIESNQHWF